MPPGAEGNAFVQWVQAHEVGLTIFSIASLLLSLPLMRFLVIRMPTDYFLNKHPVIRRGMIARNLLYLFKNTIGVLILLCGLVMVVTPGPGLLVILYGLSLVNFPGKHAIELRLVRTPAVQKAIAHIRARAGKPPLEMPPARPESGGGAGHPP